MKILFVNDYKKHSGTENFIKDCMNWLRREGHESDIAFPPKDIPPFGEEIIKTKIDMYKPDVIHFNNCCIVGMENVRYAIDEGYKCLLTMHDYWPLCRSRLFMKFDTRQCDNRDWNNCRCQHRMVNIKDNFLIRDTLKDLHIVTICDFMQDKLREFDFRGKVSTILDGIDMSNIEKPAEKVGNHVMWSGRPCIEKGFNFFVKLGRILHHEYDIEPVFTTSVKELQPNIPDYITFKGRLPYNEYTQLMNEALAYVLTVFWHEPAALPQIEAQARGVPPVVFDVGGLKEYIKNAETGFIIPPYDVDMMARFINDLKETPDMRAELGQNAREHALENLSIDRMMKEYMDLYGRL
jgi:glycosyltransferase involved in cell wall biosynthesis